MDELKLVALDKDDIDVVSTHLQDAIVKVSDVLWRPQEQRLVIALSRFDWEAAVCSGTPRYVRRRSALRFDRVTSLKCRNVQSCDKDLVLNLLAVEFVETDAPSGVVTLVFSGGGALRLDVECIECELVDLGAAWETDKCPIHVEVVEGGVDAGSPPRH